MDQLHVPVFAELWYAGYKIEIVDRSGDQWCCGNGDKKMDVFVSFYVTFIGGAEIRRNYIST